MIIAYECEQNVKGSIHDTYQNVFGSIITELLSPFCRSLNMDCENQEKDKDGNATTTGSFNNSNTNNSECLKLTDKMF